MKEELTRLDICVCSPRLTDIKSSEFYEGVFFDKYGLFYKSAVGKLVSIIPYTSLKDYRRTMWYLEESGILSLRK